MINDDPEQWRGIVYDLRRHCVLAERRDERQLIVLCTRSILSNSVLFDQVAMSYYTLAEGKKPGSSSQETKIDMG